MTDYRNLSEWEKQRIDRAIMQEIEPKHHINQSNGFEWDEPDYTIWQIHAGNYCAECWNIHYNCLCGHER